MSMTFTNVVVVLIALAASVSDARTSRVPNTLTFGATASALVYFAVVAGASGVAGSVEGCAVGLVLFFPFFALGGLGAGDVKLLATLGAWLGPREVFWVAVYGSIAGGLMAIVVAMWAGYLRQAFANVKLLVTHWRVAGLTPLPELTLSGTAAPKLAYAVPITAGLLVTLWVR